MTKGIIWEIVIRRNAHNVADYLGMINQFQELVYASYLYAYTNLSIS